MTNNTTSKFRTFDMKIFVEKKTRILNFCRHFFFTASPKKFSFNYLNKINFVKEFFFVVKFSYFIKQIKWGGKSFTSLKLNRISKYFHTQEKNKHQEVNASLSAFLDASNRDILIFPLLKRFPHSPEVFLEMKFFYPSWWFFSSTVQRALLWMIILCSHL